MLPDIDFEKIRLHRGSRDHAFEELCCQLAALEPRPMGAQHFRKGLGADAGLECFTRYADGTETGWQVKYYRRMDASLLASLADSLATALENHRGLTRFIVAIPFNLSDAGGRQTALRRWQDWKTDRIAEAAASGRTIEIDLWSASELKSRLTVDDPQRLGRTLFWFDVERLSPQWFESKLKRTLVALGSRYTPESNVELPVRRAIQALARDPFLQEQRQRWARLLGDGLQRTAGRHAAGSAEAELRTSVQQLRTAIADAVIDPDYPVDEWIGLADLALEKAHELRHAYLVADPQIPWTSSWAGLLRRLSEISDALQEDQWRLVNARSLLVTGSAGKGKSHLLADVCSTEVQHGRPCLMLMGSRFIEGDPWPQILSELDLLNVTTQTFLGALDAAAEAAGSRMLLVLDGINERNGREIWPEHLPTLLHDVAAFPRINVVVSCRSTYLDAVVPETLGEEVLPRVQHSGFGALDARAYLAHRGVSLPANPFPLEELQTPLFLKVCCDALEKRGETSFPKGALGISSVFGFYSGAVVASINRTMALTAARRMVERAIAALAEEMERSGEREIAYSRAADLVDAIKPSNGRANDDLLFQLEAEGLVAREWTYCTADASAESVRFVFERYGDHVVAKGILDTIAVGATATDIAAMPRIAAILEDRLPIHPGVIEAIAVQLPERFDVELLDLAPSGTVGWVVEDAFFASIASRAADKITGRTMELVDDHGDDQQVFEALMTQAIEPDAAFNADWLHSRLMNEPMPERDSGWSSDVVRNFSRSGRATVLVDWVLSAGDSLDAERALLAATTLAWFCSTTDRTARDTATKGIAVLLARRAEGAVSLIERFAGVDDGYVRERVVAAVYGAALQSFWSADELRRVVEVAHRHHVAGASLNILERDHLTSLVALATNRSCRPAAVPEVLSFYSPWPPEHVGDDLIETYTQRYNTGHVSTDMIVSSCVVDGDFARYVLDGVAVKFSPAVIGTADLPTVEDLRQSWIDQFMATASPEHRAGFKALVEAEEADADAWHPGQNLLAQRRHFRALVGDDQYESYRASAINWRKGGMYQHHPRADRLATTNLAWARRWVCKRAHELGWSDNLHGAFDLAVRDDRHANKVERIGKKYQWLALFELAARLTDNAALVPDRHPDDFLSLRDLDPSLLIRSTGSGDDTSAAVFWMPALLPMTSLTPEEAIDWRDTDKDFVDGPEAIEQTDPSDGRGWLALHAFRHWRFSGGPDDRLFDREIWSRLNCIVVTGQDLNRTLKRLKDRDFRDEHDQPTNGKLPSRMHLGEHGWRNIGPADYWQVDWGSEYKGGKWRGIDVPALATTASYSRELSGSDASLTDNITLCLPSLWLMEALGLGLPDCRSVSYSRGGTTLFRDPTVGSEGPSAGVVDREAFCTMLADRDLAAIWIIAGEKGLYRSEGHGFGGRRAFTRLAHSRGQEVVHLARSYFPEDPDDEQLTQFLGH